MLDIIDLIIWY